MLKLINTVNQNQFTAKVYKDTECQEYRVKFYADGKHAINADYYTEDKEDAINTANYQVNLSAELAQSNPTA